MLRRALVLTIFSCVAFKACTGFLLTPVKSHQSLQNVGTWKIESCGKSVRHRALFLRAEADNGRTDGLLLEKEEVMESKDNVIEEIRTKDNVKEEIRTKDYPIDLPAYLLLMLSTVLAIAFVGSIFEVTGPNPVLGYVPTYIIGTAALPGFLFMFYATIKKGKADEEEDDDYY